MPRVEISGMGDGAYSISFSLEKGRSSPALVKVGCQYQTVDQWLLYGEKIARENDIPSETIRCYRDLFLWLQQALKIPYAAKSVKKAATKKVTKKTTTKKHK